MRGDAVRAPWYRFRATLDRQWRGYLGLLLLVGLTGGIAMASIAGARRTQSSYPAFLTSANPSDLNVTVYSPSGLAVAPFTKTLAHLPGVKQVRTVSAPTIAPLDRRGAPRLSTLANVTVIGSSDGMFSEQDRPAIAQGRRLNPNRADEMLMTATSAKVLGVRVGDVVPLGFYTTAQEALPGFGSPSVPPALRVEDKLVGIMVLDNAVLQDDIDRAYGFVVVSPALLHRIATISSSALSPLAYGLQLQHGALSVRAVEQEIIHAAPQGSTVQFHATAPVITEVELALRPESLALGAFGAIAALVCLVLALQAISRQLGTGYGDRRVMRAIGASPKATVADGVIGILLSVLIGSVLAFAGAVGLSALAPLGPVRPFYPGSGFSIDCTVLGVGLAVLVGVLGIGTQLLSYRLAPHRMGRTAREPTRPSSLARTAELAGMPIPVVVGVRFAFEPEGNTAATSTRSALWGTVLAVMLVVATLTFADSLTALVSHPALYGWNWNYALNPTNNVPPRAVNLLSQDRDVSAFGDYDYNTVQIDGQSIPVLLARSHVAVSPPILSGHGLEAADQILIGPTTLSLLHKQVGDTVSVSYGTAQNAPLYVRPTLMKIVGTATFPTVGYESVVADHTSMGTGAMFSEAIFPASFKGAIGNPDPNLDGPELVFVKLRAGVSPQAGRANLKHITGVANQIFAADPAASTDSVNVIGVQRPAQIVNYRSIGSTPIVLAAGLAAGAIVALALTLAASVRRRRRDLALLKALGLTRRQLTSAVAWQGTVSAVLGILVGLPLGIVIGRELWTLFARSLNAVPAPAVPVLWMILVALGALVFANLVAVIPGRAAGRTPTALMLQSE